MGMQHYYRRIYDDPKFHELEKKRGIFSWSLTAIILICYFGFIMVIAFFPHIFAQTITKIRFYIISLLKLFIQQLNPIVLKFALRSNMPVKCMTDDSKILA